MKQTVVFLAALGAIPLTTGCGGQSYQDMTPDEAYTQARTAFHRGDFGKAEQLFEQTANLLPPRVDELSEVRYYIAECRFQQKRYIESAQAFQRVASEFPTSHWAPLALMRAGDANSEMWSRPELDPEFGDAAMTLYREVLARYPNTEAASRAQLKIVKLNEKFAYKDFQTASFYMSRKAYDSAIHYFRALVATYPNSELVPESLLKLVQAYQAIGYREEFEETCDHLRRFYPDTPGLVKRCPVVN